jgi:1,4-dihydroxy-2-naphthoate octaprenyltransferase
MNTLRLLVRLSRPPLLVIAALLYFMGAGVARYLGFDIDWGVYWLGQAWLVLVQYSIHALNEYFETPAELHSTGKSLFIGSTRVLELGNLPRATALWVSVASAMAAGLLTVLIILASEDSRILVVMLILMLVGLIYSVPPVRLSGSGYGELVLSIFLTALVPVFSFVLQDGEFHRIMIMVTFPLVFLFLSLLLIVEFPEYASDLKYEKPSLLLRLGWQRGISAHNWLVVGGFLLLVLAAIIGLPLRIALPVATVMPVGLTQIWLLNRIAQGVKPNWNLMIVLAVATFGMTAYFLSYGFWTH